MYRVILEGGGVKLNIIENLHFLKEFYSCTFYIQTKPKDNISTHISLFFFFCIECPEDPTFISQLNNNN